MKSLPSYLTLCTRFILSLVGLVTVIIYPLCFGWEGSYSRYYSFSPSLFTILFTTLAIGLLVHSNKEWRLPAIFLIILSIFNMYDYPILHYSSAIFFFITSTYSMWNDKRVSNFGKISLLGYPLIMFGLMTFEIFQIVILSLFHLLYILKLFILKLKK
jgi:hypothetical protein